MLTQNRIIFLLTCSMFVSKPLMAQSEYEEFLHSQDVLARHVINAKNSPYAAPVYDRHISHACEFDSANVKSNKPSDINLKNFAEPTSAIDYTRLAIVSGGMIGAMVGIHIYQQNGWWKDNRAPFHFQEDLVYGLNIDKIGHMYGATVFTFLAQRAFEWTNVSEPTALWLGAGGALMFQTYVEIEDGFSAWGFDRVDFASDVAGAAWPVARYYVPLLQNFDIKFSYHPSSLLNNPGGSGFVGQHHLIFDDYEGQTLWLSFRMHELLPNSVNSYWPSFLQLAVGYAARDIVGPNPYPVLFFSFDYDMTKIIPPDTWFLKTLGETLNFIHFPAPAVQIYPRGGSSIWYGLYF